MHEVLQRIADIGIVPVIKIEDIENAVPLAKALLAGGIPLAEITFRTSEAEGAIAAITRACPEMLVGAGTVLTTGQVDRAKAAGAKFIVSPGFNPKVVAHCIREGLPITPGCTTPSEIEQALEMGLEVVKFFPAEQSGGLAKIKSLSGPYGSVRFIPTGGIDLTNLNEYLACDKVLACGGSFMVKDAFIRDKQFDQITELCRKSMETMLGFGLAHVGINSGDAAAADAQRLASLLGLPTRQTDISCYAGELAEFMAPGGRGTHGHIGIATHSVPRAMAYLAAKGVTFEESTLQRDAKGRPRFVYLKEEIGGFALHLVQR